MLKLERKYDESLVDQHTWKTKATPDQQRTGLMANLAKDRNNIFK